MLPFRIGADGVVRARSDFIDIRIALLIQSVRFANIDKVASHHGSTTPPFAKKRANGTPPNLGGESFAHLTKCPNSAHPFRMPRRYNRAPGGGIGKTRACSGLDTASSNPALLLHEFPGSIRLR